MTKKVPNCLFVLLVLLSGAVFCGGSSEAWAQQANYALVWSDEFSAPNGSPPDSSKWIMETGGGGWGNNELESYTNRGQNVHVQDGNLVITASEDGFAIWRKGHAGDTSNMAGELAEVFVGGIVDESLGLDAVRGSLLRHHSRLLESAA